MNKIISLSPTEIDQLTQSVSQFQVPLEYSGSYRYNWMGIFLKIFLLLNQVAFSVGKASGSGSDEGQMVSPLTTCRPYNFLDIYVECPVSTAGLDQPIAKLSELEEEGTKSLLNPADRKWFFDFFQNYRIQVSPEKFLRKIMHADVIYLTEDHFIQQHNLMEFVDKVARLNTDGNKYVLLFEALPNDQSCFGRTIKRKHKDGKGLFYYKFPKTIQCHGMNPIKYNRQKTRNELAKKFNESRAACKKAPSFKNFKKMRKRLKQVVRLSENENEHYRKVIKSWLNKGYRVVALNGWAHVFYEKDNILLINTNYQYVILEPRHIRDDAQSFNQLIQNFNRQRALIHISTKEEYLEFYRQHPNLFN